MAGNPRLVRELKLLARRLGSGVLDILSFYLQPATDFDAFAAPLELGAELGARYALVAGDDAEWSRLRDNLGRFCDMAAPFGITAAVEFAVIRPLATLAQTLRLLSELDRENGGDLSRPAQLSFAAAAPRRSSCAGSTRGSFATRSSPTACSARASPTLKNSDA